MSERKSEVLAGNQKQKKLSYAVMNKAGKVKSYIDKSWCYCSDYSSAHKHN